MQSLHLLLESHRHSLESAIREHCREASAATSMQIESLERKLDELHVAHAKPHGILRHNHSVHSNHSSLNRSSSRSGCSSHRNHHVHHGNQHKANKAVLQEAAEALQSFKEQLEATHKEHTLELQKALDQTMEMNRAGSNGNAAGSEDQTRHVHMRLSEVQCNMQEKINQLHNEQSSRLSELIGTNQLQGKVKRPSNEAAPTGSCGSGNRRKTFQQNLHRRKTANHGSGSHGNHAARESITALVRKSSFGQPMGSGMLSEEPEVEDEMVDDDLGALVAAQGHFRRVAHIAEPTQRVCCGRVYDENKCLDTFSMALIILNMVYMAAEANLTFSLLKEGKPIPQELFFFDIGFLVAFLMELFWRIKLQGRHFCADPRNRYWNIFDVFVITLQLVDVLFRMTNMGFVRSLRVLRAIRAARIIRTVRYVRELRLMVASIFCSLGSLVWALVLLILVLFLFSMCLMQTLQAIFDEPNAVANHPLVMDLYGTVPMTMLSLFMAITGGRNWAELTDPLMKISSWYMVAFVLYVTFVLLGMLNILTAVFVESTNKIAEVDAELVVQEQMDRDNSALNQMRTLFLEADVDGSGSITQDEFDARLSDPKCSAQLQLLDLDVWTVRGLFKLLDMDDTGVQIEELVYAMMRLRGSAKAVDVATLLYENKRIVSRLQTFMSFTEDCFNELRREVANMNEQSLQSGMALRDALDNPLVQQAMLHEREEHEEMKASL